MASRISTLLRQPRPFASKAIEPLRLMAGFILPLLLGGGLLLTSCQGRSPLGDGGEPTDSQVTAPEGDTETSSPDPEATPNSTSPTETTETVAESPKAEAQSQDGASLPDTLTRQWEPASNVLFTFGAMTITPNEVQWKGGQSSPYTVVSTEGGYLLELESSPSFYDTPNPYIKLMPKTDEAGNTTSLDIAFYESQSKVDSEEYIMYGSYFVE